jgi:hypothetical protein
MGTYVDRQNIPNTLLIFLANTVHLLNFYLPNLVSSISTGPGNFKYGNIFVLTNILAVFLIN